MKKEKACGAAIIKDGKILMVKEIVGHWGLPKGHVENNETEIETAIREVKEETNLNVTLDENKRYKISYIIDNEIDKEVIYFVANSVDGEIIKQDSEIENIKWVPIEDAIDTISFDNAKKMVQKILIDEGYLN